MSGQRPVKNQSVGRNSLNGLSGKEWIKFTKSWFVSNPAPRGEKEVLHPAKFPEEMVSQFIEFFTKPGQLVLDPMVGTGSTLIACAELRRSGVGIELTPKYAELADARVRDKLADVRGVDRFRELSGHDTRPISLEVIEGDSRELSGLLESRGVSRVDYCITSPPYWQMLRTSRGGVESASKKRAIKNFDIFYSDDPRDLGNIPDYDRFLEAVVEIFQEVKKVLRRGGYLTVVTQNVLTGQGEMKPLAWDLAKSLSEDFTLKQERIWCQDNKQLGIWGYPTTYVSNVHHHYCLVFQKPR